MSEQQPEALAFPESGAAFADLMGFLAPETAGEGAGTDAGSAGAAGAEGGAAGGAAPAAQPDTAGTAGTPAAGAAGGPANTGAAAPTPGAPVAGGAAALGAQPAGGAPAGSVAGTDATGGGATPVTPRVIEHDVLVGQLGELTTKYEEKLTAEFQATALSEAQEEYPKYFAALETHPYALMGQELPAVGREGTIRISSTQEAKDWQDAVKYELANEIRDRASRQLDEQRTSINTVHASVELFQRNADLVPGTAAFDVELANQFASMAQPYELRVEGKLQGYTIPVQPIIDMLRTQVHAGRAATSPPSPPAAPAAGGTATTAQAPAAATPPPGEQPQAGITSKAGTSDTAEDFSTLFGTIGLPNLQI